MLHVLSAFITVNKELCCEEVKMQKRYDSQNAAFDVYSHFNWEEYESDVEESVYSEDDNESGKVVSSIPVYYITLVYGLVVAWPSMSKQHHLTCPCNPLFRWEHDIF